MKENNQNMMNMMKMMLMLMLLLLLMQRMRMQRRGRKRRENGKYFTANNIVRAVLLAVLVVVPIPVSLHIVNVFNLDSNLAVTIQLNLSICINIVFHFTVRKK